jgi:hypothetical protein
MAAEPPPDPADWICDALPSRHASESSDVPQAAPERREEPITWAQLRRKRAFRLVPTTYGHGSR